MPGPDRGAGLIGTIGGLMVFFLLLSFATQLLLNLYATSAVTAAAHDAATMAASGPTDWSNPTSIHEATLRAEDHARTILGEFGDRVSFSWQVDDDWVELNVVADLPSIAIGQVASVFGINQVDRTVTVRVEQTR